MARVASERFVFTKNYMFACFSTVLSFSHIFRIKKEAHSKNLGRSVEISDREIRYETISCILDDVGTKTTHA